MYFFRQYTKIIFINYVFVLLARLLEVILVYRYHSEKNLFAYEAMGFVSDILLLNIILAVCFPFYVLLRKAKVLLADVVFMGLSMWFILAHMLIIKYFVYQLEPVGGFLFQYNFKEISFTVRTSGVDHTPLIIMLLLPVIALLAFIRFRKRISLPARAMLGFMLLSVPLYFVLNYSIPQFSNKFVRSKSAIFYSQASDWALARFWNNSVSRKAGKKYQEAFPGRQYISPDYPFLHHAQYEDVLGNFFHKADSAPNIVLLIVEGLADNFIHPYRGQLFMPFLDSLSKRSLYWDRFLTNGERSFAAVPSLTGSLPYGEIGFTLMDKLPNHFSLVSVLNNNNYHTSFFYGQASWFHKKDAYFKYNNADLIFDNSKYAPEFSKIIVGEDKFFWGYDDKDLFSQSFKVIDTLPKKKRLDIYFTGTTHSPFIFSDMAQYNARFDKMLRNVTNPVDKAFFQAYRKYFLTLPFSNDALRKFFSDYSKRPEYKNTIFIVTGDHPMTEIPIENVLKKYHVPLIIYSPLLKQPKTFHSVGSHLDVYQSVLAYLHKNYNVKVPAVSTSISTKLDTATQYRYTQPVAFMNHNREVVDFLDNGYYIANGTEFYETDNNFNLKPAADKKKFEQVSERLKLFSQASLYASMYDKLVPDSLFYPNIGMELMWSYKGQRNISTKDEYVNLLLGHEIPNGDFYFDISGDIVNGDEGMVTGVLQIEDERDSIVTWLPFDIALDKKVFHFHYPIKKITTASGRLSAKLYLWNKNKVNYKFAGIKAAIYRRQY